MKQLSSTCLFIAQWCILVYSQTTAFNTSVGAQNYTCSPGYYGSNASCTICPVGRFCTGGQNIGTCGANSNTTNPGSVSIDDCLCRPGYFGTKGNCSSCPFASYCPGGSEKYACGPNSNTTSLRATSFQDCNCLAGYYLGDGGCEICPFGSYCPGGKNRTLCGPNSNTSSIGSSSASQCLCTTKYGSINGTCVNCRQHYYCPGGGKELACRPNSFTYGTGSSSPTDCICKPGYIESKNATCAMCPLGFYQPLAGQSECLTCPNQTTLELCDRVSFSCKAGYALSSNLTECETCLPGYYKSISGNFQCTKCPQFALSCNATQYACAPGHDLPGDECSSNKRDFKIVLSNFIFWWLNNPKSSLAVFVCFVVVLFLIAFTYGFCKRPPRRRRSIYAGSHGHHRSHSHYFNVPSPYYQPRPRYSDRRSSNQPRYY